ncbi:mitochondrial ATPase inhibitor, IATP-domain-containing protein [Diplogelasinospora grovesii]|uniref:ATPase inhibitor, mitochondrial n=1 Tax=Diplogelasinospora grovesii TaxID=303347 RepID=A0AAN6S7S9_9PEZI|nr:mitochondrial ATPase inhibitor, IATP-domain-containing protein [Diplogelasinospora grovesii]
MFRTAIIKQAPALRAISSRTAAATFTTSARVMAAGDTGAPPKVGGPGDAFQRRERANEDFTIKKREKEKLLELKKKLAEQQNHLQQLSDHIDEITKEQGGEHN